MTEVFESVSTFIRALKEAARGGESPQMEFNTRLMPGPCGMREYIVYEARAFFEKENNLRLEVCCGELKGGTVNDRHTAAVAAKTHQRILAVCHEVDATAAEHAAAAAVTANT